MAEVRSMCLMAGLTIACSLVSVSIISVTVVLLHRLVLSSILNRGRPITQNNESYIGLKE